jgi:hypothetical protein
LSVTYWSEYNIFTVHQIGAFNLFQHFNKKVSIKTRKNCFRNLKPMFPLNASICTTTSYTLWVEWYYLKNNYLTLRSKVKVPRTSLCVWRKSVWHLLHWIWYCFDDCFTYFVPVFKYCYSDSRNLWTVMRAGKPL